MRHNPSPYVFCHLSDTFEFGSYKGFTLSDVIDMGSMYIYWCVYNIKHFLLEDSVMEEIHQIYPNQYTSPVFEKARKSNLDHWRDDFEEDYVEDDFYEGLDDDDTPTYDRYGGSYAQDVMGYSDDDIETIFDGDPDAYWNID